MSGVLFDLGPRKPTTRDVARLVKEGGAEALSDAVLRADAARYQEVTCRSALNRVDGMPFRWTLNPYRGCTHGCHYCFARRYQTQLELNAGDEFASVILVKTNFVTVLNRELDHPSWTRETVALGTATDPYQPIEGHYRITRGTLEALCKGRTPTGIITKGPMAVRDVDLLQELSRRASCTIYFSIPTVDEAAWRLLEPGTAPPLQRLRAVRQLTDAGIRAAVLMAPIVPGITSQPAKIERTLKAIADHGAGFVGANVMYLKDGTRTHFLSFLSRELPHLLPQYEKMYKGAYVPASYAGAVKAIIRVMEERHGVHRPARSAEAIDTTSQAPAPSPETFQQNLFS